MSTSPIPGVRPGQRRWRSRDVHAPSQANLDRPRMLMLRNVDVPTQPSADPDLVAGRREVVVCATCELDVPWTPIRRGVLSYCCEGCAAGGPCCCSYDDAS